MSGSDWQGFHVTHHYLADLAVEALSRSNHFGIKEGVLTGHPEDLASAFVLAIQAVAVGYAEGYKKGRSSGKNQGECVKCSDSRRSGYL